MIELYSTDPHVIRLVTEAASGVCELEVHRPLFKNLPKLFDLCATSGQLNVGVERFAASYGAMTVVLPEGGEYLAEKGKRGHVSVIGADYRRVKF
jgi:hypothetical protein